MPRLARALFTLGWVAIVCLGLSLSPSPSIAGEIVILKSSDLSAYELAIEGFRSQNIADGADISVHDLQGDLATGRKLARRIRASDATLVLAVGIKAALAAKLEILDIPVVYCMVLDPEKYDLSAANLSGISLEIPIDQQLAAMRSVLPNLKRVGILYDPAKTARFVQSASAEAKRHNVQVIAREVSTERDLPPTLRALLPTVDAIWLAPDTTVLNDESLPFILQESLDANRPVFGFSSEFVKRGALLSLSVDYREIGKQAARISKQILDRKVNTPIRTVPDRFHLAINLKSARFLDITIPAEVQRRADERY
ncbi:ABC transporter substrate-binding protein [Nitrospira sp.]|nr:ABC transporter substrate-binding protein [Nitrospira sp.]